MAAPPHLPRRVCWKHRAATLLGLLLGLGSAETADAIYEVEGDTGSVAAFGTAKLFPTYARTRDLGAGHAENLWAAVGSLRLTLEGSALDVLAFEGAYHLFPIVFDDPSAVGAFGAADGGLVRPRQSLLRVADVQREIASGARFRLEHDLDRLNVLFMTGLADIRVGRQAVSHGSARILPSTDIFSPFSPASLDTEFKQGLDAVRVTVPLGEASELEAIAVGHRDTLAEGTYLGRFRHSFPGLDVSTYAGTSYRAPTAAVDVSGDLFDATFYGEVFYRRWSREAYDRATPDPPLGEGLPMVQNAWRATVGGHYYFAAGLSTILELHYNGEGAASPRDYLLAALAPGWQQGEVFLLGRYYAALGLEYELSELVSVGLSTLANLRDPSFLLMPSAAWSTSDNTSLGVGAIVGMGSPMEGGTPSSEFGLYPYTAYGDARWYF